MSEADLRSPPREALPRAGDHRAPLRAVARLATLAASSCEPDELLAELCDVAATVLDVDGIGVMDVVAGRAGTRMVRFAHAEEPVLQLERIQEALQRGPCREAVDSGDVVAVDDVAVTDGRFGDFTVRMLDAGMRAVLAVPLVGGGRTWGALDVYRRRPGPWSPDEVEDARLLAEVVASYLVVARDRDEARAARREVEHLSLHDSLTGVPNRVLLFDRIEHAVATAHRHGTVVGVAFVDLDRFKVINDSLGHAAGDEVLVEVARRLGSVVRGDDTLARLAGDEFVVVLTDLPADASTRADALGRLTARLREALREPVRAAGVPVLITASVGIAVTPAQGGVTAEGLVHRADVAMYAAKEDRDAAVIDDVA